MILLDTNIISELMKQSPSLNVIHWIDKQDIAELYLSAITIAEIKYGLSVLPDGKRRHQLETAFSKAVNYSFKHRIISFDNNAAHIYGQLMGHRKNIGKPLSILDGQIAAIARAHEAELATRNTQDFKNCELTLVNPFN
jgi:hypothetical protein